MSNSEEQLHVPLRGVKAHSKQQFCNRLQSKLQGVLDNSWWSPIERGATTYYYTNPQSRNATSQGRAIQVMPLLADRYGVVNHWIALTVELDEPPGQTFVTHVSIKVYFGPPGDDTKTMLFRAEWNTTQALTLDHGQPHWHFHRLDDAERQAEATESPLDLAIVDDGNAFLDKGWGYERVHFAMAAQFYRETPSGQTPERCVVEPDVTAEMLISWIVRTVLYVKYELARLAA